MKCNQCGTDYTGKFCPNCGAPSVNTEVTQQANNASKSANNNQVPLKDKKPIVKKWWFWLIIIIVVIAVIAKLAGGGEKSPVKESGTDTSDTSSTPTPAPEDETFGLNDTAVFDSIKITANELKESAGTEYFKPTEGNTFIGIQFTIENTSQEDQAISSILLFDAYVDGVKCDYSFQANCVFTDGTLDGDISPGMKMVGYYSVEVPANWAELELQVKDSWLSNAKASFVFNK